jgi:hypothetical protein
MNYSLGISLTILPKALVDDVIRQVPVVDIQTRIGLPLNFSAGIRLNSVYIANQAAFGLQYSYSIGALSLALGDEIAYWYGFADMEGFDTEASGWINSPFISAGLDLHNLLLTLRFELIYITSRETTVGSILLESRKNDLTGYAIMLAVEQPLWNDNDVMIAAKLNFARSLYQSWLTFSTFDKMLLHPEFIVGFVL